MPFDRSMIESALQVAARAAIPSMALSSVPIAHYTRIGTLSHFLVGAAPHVSLGTQSPGWGSAWATPVQFLNDRQELTLGLDQLQLTANQTPSEFPLILIVLDGLRTTLGNLDTDAYQMSFSGNPDELGQWRGYAANGMGCCLVTNTQEVDRVADVSGWVLYNQNEQENFARQILNELRLEVDSGTIGQTLVAAASFMKHEGFSPEKEFRLLKFPEASEVRFRETGDRLVPYIDFLKKNNPPLPLSVQKILIGPGWQLSKLSSNDFTRHHVVQGIQRLLDLRDLDQTDIESSQIPYDPK